MIIGMITMFSLMYLMQKFIVGPTEAAQKRQGDEWRNNMRKK
jgi:hypothetical protein